MHFHIADNVVFRELGSEAVILNLNTGTYFGLDAVGTRLWNLVAEHGSTSSAIQILLAEYDVEEPRLKKDVETLIDQLLAKGLLITDAAHTPSAR